MLAVAFLGFWIVCGIALHVVCAVAGCYISGEKGRGSMEGLMFGLVFGPLGLFLAVLMPEPERRVRPIVPVGSVLGFGALLFLALTIALVLRANAP